MVNPLRFFLGMLALASTGIGAAKNPTTSQQPVPEALAKILGSASLPPTMNTGLQTVQFGGYGVQEPEKPVPTQTPKKPVDNTINTLVVYDSSMGLGHERKIEEACILANRRYRMVDASSNTFQLSALSAINLSDDAHVAIILHGLTSPQGEHFLTVKNQPLPTSLLLNAINVGKDSTSPELYVELFACYGRAAETYYNTLPPDTLLTTHSYNNSKSFIPADVNTLVATIKRSGDPSSNRFINSAASMVDGPARTMIYKESVYTFVLPDVPPSSTVDIETALRTQLSGLADTLEQTTPKSVTSAIRVIALPEEGLREFQTELTFLQLFRNNTAYVRAVLNTTHPDNIFYEGFSLPKIAAEMGNRRVLQSALKRGANPDLGTFTALHAAILKGSVGMVDDLLASKADPNKPSRILRGIYVTPINIAASFGHTAIIRMLYNAGADAEAQVQGDYGKRPIHVAAANGHTDATLELAKIVDVNAVMDDGGTALIFAARNGIAPMVEGLLARGADPTRAAPRGYYDNNVFRNFYTDMEMQNIEVNPANVAEFHGHHAVAKTLREAVAARAKESTQHRQRVETRRADPVSPSRG